MCDTLVVTRAAAGDGVTLSAKNSDREPNEAVYERAWAGLNRVAAMPASH